MSTAQSPKLRLYPKRLLFLIYGVAATMIVFRMGVPRYPAIAIVLGPLVAAEALFRLLSGPKVKAFGQEILRLMQQGDDEALLPFFEEQRFLRFAGPPFELADKLGLIHAHLGNFAAAADAYRDALDGAPNKRQVEIAIKLGDALRLAGKSEEAERMYREIVAATDEHPPSNQHLARLILDRGGRRQEALEILTRAEKHARQDATGSALRCEMAQLLIAEGKLDKAETLLETAKKGLVGANDLTADELLAQTQEALDKAR